MKFIPLASADEAVLNADRDFVASLLETRHSGERLSGTRDDLALLESLVNFGPHTDDLDRELIAFGTIFGDVLARALGMDWVHYNDKHGVELALRYGRTFTVVFPRTMIFDYTDDDEWPEFERLYDEIVPHFQHMIDSPYHPCTMTNLCAFWLGRWRHGPAHASLPLGRVSS